MSRKSITVDVQSASSVAAFIPFTAVPDDWAGKKATIEAADLLAPPADTVAMPRALTAENGAKAALMGEFRQSTVEACEQCDGDGDCACDNTDHEDGCNGDCHACSGEGTVPSSISIDWTTIKAIYAAAVKLFHPEAP